MCSQQCKEGEGSGGGSGRDLVEEGGVQRGKKINK